MNAWEIRLTLERDDELGNDGEHLSLAVLEEVEHTLAGEELVRLLLFADALHEDWQVVMVVKLLGINLPCDRVGRAVLNLNGKVATVVEAAELRRRDGAFLNSTSLGGDDCRLFHRFVEGGDLATRALAFLCEWLGSASSSDGCFSGSENARLSNDALLGWHMRLGEVSEHRVLGSGEQLVVRDLVWLGASLGEKLLEMVLNGETA